MVKEEVYCLSDGMTMPLNCHSWALIHLQRKESLSLLKINMIFNCQQIKGKDTLTCMQSAQEGDIEFAFLLGGNLFSVNPDRHFSESALDNIAFKVMVSSTLNETHLFGIGNENLILPFKGQNEKQSRHYLI